MGEGENSLSNDATVSSTAYTINDAAETITDVPANTDVAVFEDNLTPATNATFEVFEADGTTPRTGDVVTGDVVVVTAEDGTTTKTYTITTL